MLLLMRLGQDRYAIDARWVVEIVPRLALQRLPQAPVYMAGLMNYRGTPVPVIDFPCLAGSSPAPAVLSTRIVVLACPAGGGRRLMGLLVKGATRLVGRAEIGFAGGVQGTGAPWLGRVAADAAGLIQELLPDRLMNDALKEELFGDPERAAREPLPGDA